MDNLPIKNDSQKLFQLLIKMTTEIPVNNTFILSDKYTEEEKELIRSVGIKADNKKNRSINYIRCYHIC